MVQNSVGDREGENILYCLIGPEVDEMTAEEVEAFLDSLEESDYRRCD